jgi:hypothetical protein
MDAESQPERASPLVLTTWNDLGSDGGKIPAMPAQKTKRKQTKKTSANSKRSAAKSKPVKKTANKKLAKKKTVPRKLLATKKRATKKTLGKTTAIVKKTANKKRTRAKAATASKKQPRGIGRRTNIEPFAAQEVRGRAAGQSGSLQGLSDAAGADSESVDELVEEGNAFEAGIVSGVEAADRADGQEVHTHEVPEDDVPGEYLDED